MPLVISAVNTQNKQLRRHLGFCEIVSSFFSQFFDNVLFVVCCAAYEVCGISGLRIFIQFVLNTFGGFGNKPHLD